MVFLFSFQLAYNITLPPDPVPTQKPSRNLTSYFNATSNTFQNRDYSTGDYASFLIDTSSYAGNLNFSYIIYFRLYYKFPICLV